MCRPYRALWCVLLLVSGCVAPLRLNTVCVALVGLLCVRCLLVVGGDIYGIWGGVGCCYGGFFGGYGCLEGF